MESMKTEHENRFDDFFVAAPYASLKNSLYNYRLRMRAVRDVVKLDGKSPILEAGSGISPLLADSSGAVRSDLSFNAMKIIKSGNPQCQAVVADITSIPFKSGVFGYVICSEVLEHVADDKLALSEMSRILRRGGKLVLTFPHRERYFGNDDLYVNHYRRYELDNVLRMLQDVSLKPVKVKKVLGPGEKLTMSFLVFCITSMERSGKSPRANKIPGPVFTGLFKLLNVLYAYLMQIDAWICPRSLASVLLVEAEKI